MIATSAVPQLKPLSLVKVFWAKITGQEGVRPDFGWKGDQLPEQVSSDRACDSDRVGQELCSIAEQASWQHLTSTASILMASFEAWLLAVLTSDENLGGMGQALVCDQHDLWVLVL